jgi:hypothetical protein
MVVSGTDLRETSPLNIHDCFSLLLSRALEKGTSRWGGSICEEAQELPSGSKR